MKILEIRLFLSFFSKYGFKYTSNLNWILKPRIFFQKWIVIIFERLRWSFDFEFVSNSDFIESEHFLLALINLKQYISTKINA
jgi:hypothetical protein